MKKVDFSKYIPAVTERLSGRGLFLNTRLGDKSNTMTIGWGFIGIMWGKPVFVVAVRYSRHTYKLIDSSGEFTVSVPLSNDHKKALAFCGSKSGRDFDKFKECGLTPIDGVEVSSPYIDECDLHYECKVIYKQAMEPGIIFSDTVRKHYPKGDYHVLFYGEIVNCFTR